VGLAVVRSLDLRRRIDDPVELEDAFWISREDLADAFADRHPRMKPPRPGAIAAFLMKGWLADRRV